MFAAACGPSLLEVRGDYSLVAVHGFLIAETSPCRAQTLGAWASLVAAPQTQYLWLISLVAPWHVEILVLRPGLESASPAFADRFLTNEPQGKS